MKLLTKTLQSLFLSISKVSFVTTVLVVLLTQVGNAKIIYVDSASTSGLQNGQLWSSAYSDFNRAFADAVEGDELWFAKGTYNGFNTTTHVLDKSLSFYGGFENGDESLDDRDFELNPVTFISEINGAATPLFSSGVDEDIVFDGISFGRMAILIFPTSGVTALGNRLSIKNGTIQNRTSTFVFLSDDEFVLELSNVEIKNNSNALFTINKVDSLLVDSSMIYDNSGMLVSARDINYLKLDSVTFENNNNPNGSCISGDNILEVHISRCKMISNNWTVFLSVDSLGDLFVKDSQLENNEMSLFSFTPVTGGVTIDNCDIIGNSGGDFFSTNNPVGTSTGVFGFYNSTFSDNSNDVMINAGSLSLEIEGCMIKGNNANSRSTFISMNGGEFCSISNVIFENDSVFSELFSLLSDNITFTNSKVINCGGRSSSFAFLSSELITLKNFDFESNSIAFFGTMLSFTCDVLDFDDVNFLNNVTTLGSTFISFRVDEFTHIIDSKINNNITGNLFNSVNGADSFTLENSEVKNNTASSSLINTGSEMTYIINSDFEYNTNGIWYLNGQDIEVNNSRFLSDTSIHNGYPYITASEGVEINNSSFIGQYSDRSAGGAVFCRSGIIHNSIFENNFCNHPSAGGAIYCESGLEILDSEFRDNGAKGIGGAISASGNLKIDNVLFENNKSDNSGGAVYDRSGGFNNTALFNNCIFKSNLATSFGVFYGSGVFSNCLMQGNTSSASRVNGELIGGNGTRDYLNCTITDNTYSYLTPDGAKIRNSIIYNNNAYEFDENRASARDVQYSNTDWANDGEGNLHVNPQFVDPENGDYRLSCTSPLINKGNNAYATSGIDFYGLDRIIADTVDMGAFEFDGDPAVVTAIPVPVFNVVNTESCISQEVLFANETIDSAKFSFFWDFGDGITTSNETEPSVTYSKPGTYTVELTATNGCGISETISNEVVITDAFIPSILHPTTVCPGDTFSFTTNAGACNNIIWSVTNGVILSGQGSVEINVVFENSGNAGNASITLEATSCEPSNVCELPVSIEVPIIPTNPEVLGETAFCENTSGDYKLAISSDIPGVLYSWSAIGGTISSESEGFGLDSITVDWGDAGQGQLMLTTFYQLLDCKGFDTIQVEIKPKFEISTSLASCGNGFTDFDVDQAGDFTWTLDGGFTSFDNTTGEVVWANDSGYYNVSVTPNVPADFCNAEGAKLFRLNHTPVIDTILGEIIVDTITSYTYEIVSLDTLVTYNTVSVVGGQRSGFGKVQNVLWRFNPPFSLSASISYLNEDGARCQSESYVLSIEKTPFKILGPDTVCINTEEVFTANIDSLGATYKWVIGSDTLDGNAISPNLLVENTGENTIYMLVDINGMSHVVSKEVIGSSLTSNISVDGSRFIGPSGGGDYEYIVNNPNDLELDYLLTGEVNSIITDSSVQVTWGEDEPYRIEIVGGKVGEVCSTDTTVFNVQKAQDLNANVSFESGKLCLNENATLVFNADNLTGEVSWSITGDAIILSETKRQLEIAIGNTATDLQIHIDYERFGAFSFDTTITVGELPSPKVVEAMICGDSAAQLITEDITYTSFEWRSEPEGVVVSNNDTVLIDEPGFYHLTVTDIKGCVGDTTYFVEKVDFKEAVIYESITSSCPGIGDFSFGLSTFINTNYNYEWFRNDVLINTGDVIISVDMDKSISKTDTIRLEITSKLCSSKDSVFLTILDTCIKSIDTTNNNNNGGCKDSGISYEVNDCQPFEFNILTNQTSGVSWDFGDDSTSNELNPIKTYEDVGYYSVQAKRGCRAWGKLIEVPVIARFEVKEDVCSDQLVEFIDYSPQLPTANVIKYEWDFGDDSTFVGGTNLDRSINYIYDSVGVYNATLTIYNLIGLDTCIFIDSQRVVVNESPMALFSINSPGCENSVYTFENTSVVSTSEANYSWDLVDLQTESKSPSVSYNIYGDKEIALIVEDFIGCIDTILDTINVTAPIESMPITVIGENTYLCQGDSIELQGPISVNGYLWYKDGVSIGLSTRSVFVKESGIYSVLYGDPSCDIFSESVEISGFFPDVQIVQNVPACLNQSVSYTLDNIPNNISLQWYQNGDLVSETISYDVERVTQADDVNVYVILTENDQTTLCEYVTDSIVSEVFSTPAMASIVLSANGVCYDSSAFVRLTNADVNNIYDWLIDGLSVNNSNDTLFLERVTEEQSVSIELTDMNGCKSTSFSRTLQVTTGEELKLTSSDSEICQYTGLEVQTNLEGSDFEFVWYNGLGDILATNRSTLETLSAPLEYNGGIYAIATTTSSAVAEGCLYLSDTVDVVVLAGPEQPEIIGDTLFCEGEFLDLSTNTTDATLLWSNSSSQDNIRVYTEGIYSLSAADESTGCTSRSTQFITQNPLPKFNFLATGFYDWCGNEELEFESLDEFATYQWKLSGNNYGNERTALIPRQSGKYTVEATTFAGCTDESDTLRINSEACGACEVIVTEDQLGAGSLRDAIICANSNEGVDFIVFNIPGTGPFQFTIDNELPTITEGVIINGFSQSTTNEHLIEITSGAYDEVGFNLGFSIEDFALTGVTMSGFENAVKTKGGLGDALINDNVFSNNDIALNIANFGNSNVISGNSFTDGVAIKIDENSSTTITRNEFDDLTNAILAEGSDELLIEDNEFINLSGDGIVLQTTESVIIESNHFGQTKEGVAGNNAMNGLVLDANAEISNNVFANHGINGVLVYGQGFNLNGQFVPNDGIYGFSDVVENEFLNNGLAGIETYAPGVKISKNVFLNLDTSLEAIRHTNGGNIQKPNLGINSHEYGYNTVILQGFGSIGDTIEVFKNDNLDQQALEYIGSVVIGSNSRWGFEIGIGEFYSSTDRSYYTMTMTDQVGNTTRLDDPYPVAPNVCGGVVNNTLDNGNGSLRREIECANLDPDHNVILFDLDSVLGAKEIVLSSRIDIDYPISMKTDLSDSITIKGTLRFLMDSDNSSASGLVFEGANLTMNSSDNFEVDSCVFKQGGTALSFSSIEKFAVFNSRFENLSRITTMQGSTVKDGRFENCIFANNTGPIRLGNGFGGADEVYFNFLNNYVYGNESQNILEIFSNVNMKGNHIGITEDNVKALNTGMLLVGFGTQGILVNLNFEENEVLNSDVGLQITSALGLSRVVNNTFGITKNGVVNNGLIAIQVGGNVDIEDNLFVGYDSAAVKIEQLTSGNNPVYINSNQFGFDSSGVVMPNVNGIFVSRAILNKESRIWNNVIGYSSGNAIFSDKIVTGIQIDSNYIGININGDNIGGNNGLTLAGANDEVIVLGNIIANNTGNAISVSDRRNQFTQNMMFNNGDGIVHQQPNGNRFHPSPVIVSNLATLDELTIFGEATKKDTIELFVNDSNENNAISYLASVVADEEGKWTYSFENIKDEVWVITTATDTLFNTSEFSAPYFIEQFLCSQTVTNTNDEGNGSLRRAMECANESGEDILVDISGTGTNTIELQSSLPILNRATVISINGTDQEGDALLVKGNTGVIGFNISNVTVTNIALQDFGTAIVARDNSAVGNVTVSESDLAISVMGDEVSFNNLTLDSNQNAIEIESSSDVTVENSIITKNTGESILITNSTDIDILSNDIGSVTGDTLLNGNGVNVVNSSLVKLKGNNIYSSESSIVVGEGSQQITISQNELVSVNTFDPISLVDDVVNNSKDTVDLIDAEQFGSSVSIIGEGNNGDLVEIFISTSEASNALAYVESVRVTNGTWELSIPEGASYSSADTNWYVGTATDVAGNTSELTSPIMVLPYLCSFEVTNTDDRGNGSFRRAIKCANDNEGLNTITFNIDDAAVDQIVLESELPLVTDELIIDGGNSIIIKTEETVTGSLLSLSADGSVIRDLTFSNVDRPLFITADDVEVSNVIFDTVGLAISAVNTSNVTLDQNTINYSDQGIRVTNSTDIRVTNSKVSNINQFVSFINSSNNTVVDNTIVGVKDDLSANLISNDNNSKENLIRFNLFTELTTENQLPIQNNTAGNNGNTIPTINDAIIDDNTILLSGVSAPNDTIDLYFSDNETVKNVVEYFGSTTASASGNWSVEVRVDTISFLLATATDESNNTSMFSDIFLLDQLVIFCPVTVVADTGEGSLREAIACVNEAGGNGFKSIVFFELEDVQLINTIDVIDSGFVITSPKSVIIDAEETVVVINSVNTETAFSWEVDEIDVRNLDFTAFDTAFAINNGSSNTLTKNKFADVDYAIVLENGAGNNVDDNQFVSGNVALDVENQNNLKIINNDFGLEVSAGTINRAIIGEEIHSSDINNNTIGTGVSTIAIALDTSSNNYIRNNTVTFSGTGSVISINNSFNNSITNNDIVGGDIGLAISNSNEFVVSGNDIDSSKVTAIDLSSTNGVLLSKNLNNGLLEGTKSIDLHYGTSLESNNGYPRPEFIDATYKNGNLILKGETQPLSEVEIFITNSDSIDLEGYVVTITADEFGNFEYVKSVLPTQINNTTYRATSTFPYLFLDNGQLSYVRSTSDNIDYAYTSEASKAFNPEIKICYVTNESDLDIEGSLRHDILLANNDECNLMLFDVDIVGNVNISPEIDLPEITASKLTIDATSQEGYSISNGPVVFINNESDLSHAFKVNGADSKIFIHGAAIRDYDYPIVVEKSEYFENSQSYLFDFKETAIDFNDLEAKAILIDQNLYTSSLVDYVLDIESPNVIVENNILRGGNINAINVASDSIIIISNTIEPNGQDNVYAIFAEGRDSLFIRENIINSYHLGIHADDVDRLTISKNEIVGPIEGGSITAVTLGVFVENSDSAQVLTNTINKSDSAIVIFNSFKSETSGNEIDSSNVGIHIYQSDSASLQTNLISNSSIGIFLDSSLNAVLKGNIVYGHDSAGIWIDTTSTGSWLSRNIVGAFGSGLDYSSGFGVLILSDSNIVGGSEFDRNQISRNIKGGIRVDSSVGNLLTFNQIYDNDTVINKPIHFAISHVSNGNNLKVKPIIDTYEEISLNKTYRVIGTSEPNDSIHLYHSLGFYQNARYFIGKGKADAAGDWAVIVDTASFERKLIDQTLTVVATATDAGDNTSELSDMHYVGNCFVTNSDDEGNNEYPIPNSFRQGVKCINSTPVQESLLFAIPTSLEIRLSREMIPANNVNGMVFNGLDRIRNVKVKVSKNFEEEFSDTTAFWRLSDSLGVSTFNNLELSNFDSTLVVEAKDSIEINSFDFSSIGIVGIVTGEKSRNYVFNDLTILGSPNGVFVSIRDSSSNISVNRMEALTTKTAVLVSKSDSIYVRSSTFDRPEKAITFSGVTNFEIEKNEFNVGGLNNIISIDDSRLGSFMNNMILDQDTGVAVIITNSDSISVDSNDFDAKTIIGLQLSNTDHSFIRGNTFGEVDSIAIIIEEADSIALVGNQIRKLQHKGFVLINSTEAIMSQNIMASVDTVDGNITQLIDLSLSSDASNLSKAAPVIDNYIVKKLKDCDEESIGFYVFGSAEPNDRVEVFVSDSVSRTFTEYLGSTLTDSTGYWEFRIPRDTYVQDQDFIYSYTATATDTLKYTSQVSNLLAFDNVTNDLVITNLNNAGNGSFRNAIEEGNCSDLHNVFVFNIEGNGPYGINVIDSSLSVIDAFLGFTLDARGTQGTFLQENEIADVDSTVTLNLATLPDSVALVVGGDSDSSRLRNLVIKDSDFGLKLYNPGNRINDVSFIYTLDHDTKEIVALTDSSSGSHNISSLLIDNYDLGTLLEGTVSGTSISNSDYQAVKEGVLIHNGVMSVTIENNTFDYDSVGVSLYNLDRSNFVIENTFGSADNPITKPAITLRNASSQFIVNNHIPYALSTDLDTTYAVIYATDTVDLNQISSNRIGISAEGLSPNTSNMIGIRIKGDADGYINRNNSITANDMAGMSQPGIVLENTFGGFVSTNFLGVDTAYIQRNGEPHYRDISGIDTTAIVFDNVEAINVSGNSIVNYRDYGIDLRNSVNVTMDQNIIFSEFSENKGIQLNLETQVFSNNGVIAPVIDTNEVLSRDQIKIFGSSSYANAEIQLYEGFSHEETTPDQSLRYIQQVTSDADGNWEITLPSEDFGFGRFNKYVAQVNVGQNSSEFSTLFTVKSLLCLLSDAGVDLLDSSFTPCPGSNFTVDAQLDGLTYKWFGDQSQFDTIRTKFAQIDTSATVTLRMEDQFDCVFEETFVIEYKEKPVDPIFLVSSDVFVSDTIVLVDISQPERIDSVDWTSSEAIAIVSTDDELGTVIGLDGKEYPSGREVRFIVPDEGEYTITQRSLRDGCFVSDEKTIIAEFKDPNVVDPYELTPGINELVVYPTPISAGEKTNIFITASTEEEIQVRVSDLLGVPVFERFLIGQTSYVLEFDTQQIPAGNYIVNVITETSVLSYQIGIK